MRAKYQVIQVLSIDDQHMNRTGLKHIQIESFHLMPNDFQFSPIPKPVVKCQQMQEQTKHIFLNGPTLGVFFCIFVLFGRIQTRIVGVEGEHADHLTTTTTKITYFNIWTPGGSLVVSSHTFYTNVPSSNTADTKSSIL